MQDVRCKQAKAKDEIGKVEKHLGKYSSHLTKLSQSSQSADGQSYEYLTWLLNWFGLSKTNWLESDDLFIHEWAHT